MKSREVTGSCVAILSLAGLVLLGFGGTTAEAREAGGPTASKSPAPSIPSIPSTSSTSSFLKKGDAFSLAGRRCVLAKIDTLRHRPCVFGRRAYYKNSCIKRETGPPIDSQGSAWAASYNRVIVIRWVMKARIRIIIARMDCCGDHGSPC